MTKYEYVTVRFVPNPMTGEYVNVATIVGSSDTDEWDLASVGEFQRARKLDRQAVSAAVLQIAEWQEMIETYLDSIDADEAPDLDVVPSHEWLSSLHRAGRGVVQVTRPLPLVADSIEHASTLASKSLVPESPRAEQVRKTRATSQLEKGYTAAGLRRDRDFLKSPLLRVGDSEQKIDFAIVNGSVLGLTHAFSFRTKQESHIDTVRSWGWAMRKVRDGDATVLSARGEMAISGDIPIDVVAIEPALGESSSQLEAAAAVFQDVRATVYTLDDVAESVRHATELVTASP